MVLTVLRNGIGQILILEKEGICSLPGGPLEASQSLLKVSAKYILDDTGLSINGIHEIRGKFTMSKPEPTEFQGMSSYVCGGKLGRFPTSRYHSVSWVSLTTALCISSLTNPSRHFIEECKWLGN